METPKEAYEECIRREEAAAEQALLELKEHRRLVEIEGRYLFSLAQAKEVRESFIMGIDKFYAERGYRPEDNRVNEVNAFAQEAFQEFLKDLDEKRVNFEADKDISGEKIAFPEIGPLRKKYDDYLKMIVLE